MAVLVQPIFFWHCIVFEILRDNELNYYKWFDQSSPIRFQIRTQSIVHLAMLEISMSISICEGGIGSGVHSSLDENLVNPKIFHFVDV